MDVWNLKGGQLKILKQNEIEEIHQLFPGVAGEAQEIPKPHCPARLN